MISNFPLEYGIVYRHYRSLVGTNSLSENIREVLENIFVFMISVFLLVGVVTSSYNSDILFYSYMCMRFFHCEIF